MNKILTSENSPLRIDTIKLPGRLGRIGMTLCPGKKDSGQLGKFWDRDLGSDLAVISAWGAKASVTLMEGFELDMLGVATLPALCRERNIEWHHMPIRDLDVPDDTFEAKWEITGCRLREILTDGGNVLLHCRGGIGRTGTIAARLLVELGFEPLHAITMVRKTRPGTIETTAQEQYVLRLKKWPRHAALLREFVA